MKINNETKVGILVVAVCIILLMLTWKAGGFDVSREGYEIKVHFKNIDGVALNAPVSLNGLEVGRVSGIDILYGDHTVMELTLWLRATAKLHQSAEAYIKNLGFMGEKYVGLTSGDDTKAFVKAGDVLQGREPVSFEQVLSQGGDIASNLQDISQEVNSILQKNSGKINQTIENLDVTVKNVADITTNVRERLDVNRLTIDEMAMNLNKASKNLEEMSYDLKLNPWKLLYKEPKKVKRQE